MPRAQPRATKQNGFGLAASSSTVEAVERASNLSHASLDDVETPASTFDAHREFGGVRVSDRRRQMREVHRRQFEQRSERVDDLDHLRGHRSSTWVRRLGRGGSAVSAPMLRDARRVDTVRSVIRVNSWWPGPRVFPHRGGHFSVSASTRHACPKWNLRLCEGRSQARTRNAFCFTRLRVSVTDKARVRDDDEPRARRNAFRLGGRTGAPWPRNAFLRPRGNGCRGDSRTDVRP